MSDQTGNPLVHGLLGRCPRCGHGALFTGLIGVQATCSHCGEALAELESADGPAVFVMFIVGAIVVPAALITEVNAGWSVARHLITWLPLAVILTLALLRPLKGLMLAIQYKTKARDTGDIV
ncbi:MAG: DUF983 domain-containing protein [Geminicoccaceae bacterium]